MKHLDKIANIAVIIGVAVFLVLVARNELTGRADPNSPKALLGTKINLPELRVPLQRNSLVLALSTTCHFCKYSLPFYKSLAAQVQGPRSKGRPTSSRSFLNQSPRRVNTWSRPRCR